MSPYFKTINKLEKLIPGNTYHIFNKAIGSDKLFLTPNDYSYFLQKLERYILPIADIISYCLIPNHFHILVNIKEVDRLPEKLSKQYKETPELYISQVFSNFFNSYSKSFNKAHNREGRLFLYPFKRILVEDSDYMMFLINYIHRNPIHHGIVNSFSEWEYSSYSAIISNKETKVSRKIVLDMFGSKDEYITFHTENITKHELEKYLFE